MKKNYEIAGAMMAGVIFYNIICPLLESIGNLINTKIAKTMNKDQITMQLDQIEGQAAGEVIQPNINNTAAIGFNVAPEINIEEDNYDKRKGNE